MIADIHGLAPDTFLAPHAALGEQGFTIVRAAAPRALVRKVAADLSPDFTAAPFCKGGFYGEQTKRFGRLLSRSDAVADLVLSPEIIGLAERALLPWCDTLQLNLTQARQRHRRGPCRPAASSPRA